jgi:hypothetical protein
MKKPGASRGRSASELISQGIAELGDWRGKTASLQDPARLFNSSLDGNVRRAIDIHQGAKS